MLIEYIPVTVKFVIADNMIKSIRIDIRMESEVNKLYAEKDLISLRSSAVSLGMRANKGPFTCAFKYISKLISRSKYVNRSK